ncbi:hypothetical protein GCM10010331_74900 [Streptomyces xanthochromogenes]|nr:hypothetical protein GCM10010331_74900 [Streptomyces xanthochromogenes]
MGGAAPHTPRPSLQGGGGTDVGRTLSGWCRGGGGRGLPRRTGTPRRPQPAPGRQAKPPAAVAYGEPGTPTRPAAADACPTDEGAPGRGRRTAFRRRNKNSM